MPTGDPAGALPPPSPDGGPGGQKQPLRHLEHCHPPPFGNMRDALNGPRLSSRRVALKRTDSRPIRTRMAKRSPRLHRSKATASTWRQVPITGRHATRAVEPPGNCSARPGREGSQRDPRSRKSRANTTPILLGALPKFQSRLPATE